MELSTRSLEVRGALEASGARHPLRVAHAYPHSLSVTFDDRASLPPTAAHFDRLKLSCAGRELSLGPCQFDAYQQPGPGGEEPQLELGDGRLRFDGAVYDFRALLSSGRITELRQHVQQLPLVLGRQAAVAPQFRAFVSRLIFDLQVFRTVFDELDRNLGAEAEPVRTEVQRIAVESEYSTFCRFFDERLAMLEDEVRQAPREVQALNGFFFRKQAWDLIASSEFLLRTNLKPRGYAGDSLMMRMIYEQQFRGSTVFSRFMHRHPIDSPAAQAVRNRRLLLADACRAASQRAHGRCAGSRARVLSVACGPAWELNDVLSRRDEFEKYELVLLDQDSQALSEAAEVVAALEATHQARARVSTLHDSVRTMLRGTGLAERWGQFDLIYSMGLFDYLTQPVAKAVLARLYGQLRPGGELLIGNFHHRNPTRTYMEYWMDWVLCYRGEDELAALARPLPGAVTSLSFEAAGCQMFLRVVRP